MVVDRGGLRYPIEIVDKFTNTLQTFRTSVRESRADMTAFRRTIRKLGTDSASISAAARATLDLARNTRLLTTAQTQADKSGVAAIKQRQLTEKQILAIQKQRVQLLIAKQKLEAAGKVRLRQCLALEVALRKEAERRAAAVQRAASAQAKAAASGLLAGKRLIAGSKRQNRELKKTSFLARQVNLTFRSLFRTLAAFTIARAGIRGFGELIKLGVAFNNTIELTRLGFAGIILSAGELVTAQGRIVQGQEGFNAALRISGRIQDELRVRALETTATFGELSVAFQQAIAPGLEAGLSIDQILDLTVGLSQAATAIGLEQNKLAEEVRSILAGTARAQTTRIAALLGGATAVNKLRREAKDADDFFDKLIGRLQGVRIAAALAAKTIPGLFARIRDAFAIVAGSAATGLTAELLDTLSLIFTTLVKIDVETGKIKPNPDVVKAFQGIFTGVKQVLGILRQVGREVGLKGLQTITTVIGQSLRLIASFLAGIIEGFRAIGSVLLTLAAPFIEMLGGIEDVNEAVIKLVRILGTVLIVSKAIKLSMFLWARGIGAATLSAQLLGGSLSTIGTGLLGIVGKVFRLPLIFAAITQGVLSLVNAVTGLDISLGDFGNVLFTGLKSTFEGIFRFAKFGFKELANSVTGFFTFGRVKIFDTEEDKKELKSFLAVAKEEMTDLILDIGGVGKAFDNLEEDARTAGLGVASVLENARREIRRIESRVFRGEGDAERLKILKERVALEGKLNLNLRTIQEPADDAQIAAFEKQQLRANLAQEQANTAKKLLLAQRLGASEDVRAVIASRGKAKELKRQLDIDKLARKIQIQKLETDIVAEESLIARNLLRVQAADLGRQANAEADIAQTKIDAEIDNTVELQRVLQINRLIKKQDVEESIRKAALSQQEVDAARRILALEQLRAPISKIDLAITENKVAAIKAELKANTDSLRATELRIIAEKSGEISQERQNELSAEWNVLRTESIAKAGALTNQLLAQEESLRRQKVIAEGDFLDGFGVGLLQLSEGLPTAAEEGIAFIKDAVTGLGQFIAKTIVDAFDPTKDNTIQERFAVLLSNLAQQLLQSIAIKLIAELLTPSSDGFARTPAAAIALGFTEAKWKGGPMKGGGRASAAHYQAPRGLHTGGPTSGPPKGLHPSDNIPIWAAEGEFMMKVAAVKKYGLNFMANLNAGLLDPGNLPALGAATGRTTFRKPTGPGFAHGGEISTTNTTTELPAVGSGAPSILPIFTVREADMEALLAGGEATMLQFLRDHADETSINSSQGQ